MAATPPFNCPRPPALLSDRKIYREEGPWLTGGEGSGDRWGEKPGRAKGYWKEEERKRKKCKKNKRVCGREKGVRVENKREEEKWFGSFWFHNGPLVWQKTGDGRVERKINSLNFFSSSSDFSSSFCNIQEKPLWSLLSLLPSKFVSSFSQIVGD